MSIKQLTASYLLHEDRLLFRVNTLEDAEYRFWLTRRITLFILGAAQHLLTTFLEKQHSTETAKAVADFDKGALQEKIFKTDASKPSEGEEVYRPGSIYPIGPDPLVVMDVQCNTLEENEETLFSFNFILPGGGSSNLKLSAHMTQAMSVLLDKLSKGASWGEPQIISENVDMAELDLKPPVKSSINFH